MADRKRKRGPRPGDRDGSGAAAPPPPGPALPTDQSRAARRARERSRRDAMRDAAGAIPFPADVAGAAPAAEPVFFFGFAIPRAKLAFARFWIFGLLAVDAYLQLRHAPRYGAGGFNVGHLAVFDHAAPSRVAVGVAYVVQAVVFGAAALGVGSRLTVGLGAALYAWVYFASQLDSYQHHYLMALVLALSIAVPWFRPRGTAAADGDRPVVAWAVRVILLQLAVLYAWAAVAKLEASWLDGSALRAALHTGAMRELIEDTVGFSVTAGAVLGAEVFLAATIWNRRMWPFAVIVGVGLHVGIAVSGLEIGLFSWLMVAFYVLIVPDRWFVAAWRAVRPAAVIARVERALATADASGAVAVAAGAAFALAVVLA